MQIGQSRTAACCWQSRAQHVLHPQRARLEKQALDSCKVCIETVTTQDAGLISTCTTSPTHVCPTPKQPLPLHVVQRIPYPPADKIPHLKGA